MVILVGVLSFCLKPYKSLQNALKHIYTLWYLIPGIGFTEERHASSYGICLRYSIPGISKDLFYKRKA